MPNLQTAIKNEKTKLSANFMNTVAAGLIALSFLGPLFDSSEEPIYSGLVFGIGLHFFARFFLGRLEDD